MTDAYPMPTSGDERVSVCHVDSLCAGPGHAPLLIAGPCVIESHDSALRHAEAIREIASDAGFQFVFKSSFDKANRTSIDSFRGPGLDEGLKTLATVRRDVGVPVLTDVHDVTQVSAAAEVVDIMQIPAFLCRQTDLLTACAASGKAVNVKKGQFLAPEDMQQVVGKLHASGARNILLTERGTTFGYGNLVVDMRGLPVMRSLGHPVIFDATHSVQRPGGLGSKSGGDRRQVPALARAAAAVGVDGFFMEMHEDPDQGKSDGPNMVPLAWAPSLLHSLAAICSATKTPAAT